MIDTNAFAKLVPGFDFLNNLMQSAGEAAPAGVASTDPGRNPQVTR